MLAGFNKKRKKLIFLPLLKIAVRYIPRLMRYYSTLKVPAILWVKHNGNQPTQVTTKGCKNVVDFADKVREELSTNCQFASLDKEPLWPGLKITDLLPSDLKNNSDETPLFAKLSPVVQDPVVTKTIYKRIILRN